MGRLSRTSHIGRRELHLLAGTTVVLTRSTIVLRSRNLVRSTFRLPVAGKVASVVFEGHVDSSLEEIDDARAILFQSQMEFYFGIGCAAACVGL